MFKTMSVRKDIRSFKKHRSENIKQVVPFHCYCFLKVPLVNDIRFLVKVSATLEGILQHSHLLSQMLATYLMWKNSWLLVFSYCAVVAVSFITYLTASICWDIKENLCPRWHIPSLLVVVTIPVMRNMRAHRPGSSSLWGLQICQKCNTVCIF